MRVALVTILLWALHAAPTPAKDADPLETAIRSVLGKREGTVNVTVGMGNLPPAMKAQKGRLLKLVDALKRVLGDRVRVRHLDLTTPKGRVEARKLGLEPVVFATPVDDEIDETEGWMGLRVEVGAHEPFVFPVLAPEDDHANIAYEVLREIDLQTNPPAMGFTTPEEEAWKAEDFGGLFKPATASSIGLDKPVPKALQALVVVAPRDLSTNAVYHLEQYLLGGGRVVVLLNPLPGPSLFGEKPARVESGLRPWLKHLGVDVGQHGVGDQDNLGVFISNSQVVRFPYWPIVQMRTNDIAGAERYREMVLLRWPVSVSVDSSRIAKWRGVATTLATTSARGFLQPDLMKLRSEAVPETKRAPIPVAMSLRGTFTGMHAKAPEGVSTVAHRTQGRGHLIVIGDASTALKTWFVTRESSQAIRLLAQLNGESGLGLLRFLRTKLGTLMAPDELRALLGSGR